MRYTFINKEIVVQRFKLLLSGLFFIYLIIDGFGTSHFSYFSFYLAAILIVGLVLDWYWTHHKNPQYNKSVRISSIPPIENNIFQLLGNLMRNNALEMRLRRAESLWNITLLKTTNGITRMMGRGSAPSISEAIMRAEGDFEKRNAAKASEYL